MYRKVEIPSMKHNKLLTITLAGLLCAIGIIIPRFSPIKIVLEPASFTLASHVAIFVAMFISPTVAISVTLGTTLGFLLGGFPIVVVMRAFSQIIFAAIGAFMLKKDKEWLGSGKKMFSFGLLTSLIHALGEVAVVIPFYFTGTGLSAGYYDKGFFISVILLVGIGTLVHSMVDYGISLAIWKPLRKVVA